MGVLKVKIPDELDAELRKLLPAKKGAISEFVTKAIMEKIERMKKDENN